MNLFERNWRYLAWRTWPQASWEERLHWMKLPLAELETSEPQPSALESTAMLFGVEALTLLNTDLLVTDGVDVLRENLQTVFRQRGERGYMTQLARRIGVTETTLSRWAHGEATPRASHLQELIQLLHLPPDIDTYPYFLSPYPISHAQRVQTVQGWVAALTPQNLQTLYPALERLLGGRP